MSNREIPQDVFEHNILPFLDRGIKSKCNRCSKNLYSKVVSMNFSFKNIDDHSLKNLKTDLKMLNLQDCQKITDLSNLRHLHLTHLNVSNCRELVKLDLNGECMTHLELGMTPNLDDLDVLSMPLVYLGMRGKSLSDDLIAGLHNLPLQYLDLSDCSKEDSIQVSLPEYLRVLNLSGCRIQIRMPKYLQYLDLSFYNIDLESLTQLEFLQYLDLSDCKTVGNISLLESLTNLKYLDLSYCNVLDKDMLILKKIPLEYLNLTGCQITDIGMGYLKGSSLKVVEMGDNRNITLEDSGIDLYLTSQNFSRHMDPAFAKYLKCKYLPPQFQNLWK
jgi:hypothetical protein